MSDSGVFLEQVLEIRRSCLCCIFFEIKDRMLSLQEAVLGTGGIDGTKGKDGFCRKGIEENSVSCNTLTLGALMAAFPALELRCIAESALESKQHVMAVVPYPHSVDRVVGVISKIRRDIRLLGHDGCGDMGSLLASIENNCNLKRKILWEVLTKEEMKHLKKQQEKMGIVKAI